jgi:hypothetical protein
MLRVGWLVVAVCLSASSVARADASAEQTRTSEGIEFAALVEKADRARLAGRTAEAALAYEAALKRHRDPVLLGRYGLVLMKLGHLADAAEALHAAFERGQGVSVQERREVSTAYDKAKASTTWVNIAVSQMGATIVYDGNPLSREAQSSFWMFAMPGEHTLRAQLDGYEDAEVKFTAKAGEEITVTLKLVPLAAPKLPDLPAPVVAPIEARNFPPWLPTSNIADDPNYSPKEDPFYGEPKDTKPAQKKSGPRFSVTGGVVTVFGVASWNPAVGGVVGVGVRPKEFLSFGLEGRAAWLTTDVVSAYQISAMTAGGIVSACGHLKWFFGCGLASIGALNIKFSEESYTGKSSTDLKVGGGGRIGVLVHAYESFFVSGSVDILKLSRGTRIAVDNRVIADIVPIWVGGQISGGWEF